MKLTISQLRRIIKEEVEAVTGMNKVVAAWHMDGSGMEDPYYVWKYADGSGNAAADLGGKLGGFFFSSGTPFEDDPSQMLHPIPLKGRGSRQQRFDTIEPVPVPVGKMEALIAATPNKSAARPPVKGEWL